MIVDTKDAKQQVTKPDAYDKDGTPSEPIFFAKEVPPSKKRKYAQFTNDEGKSKEWYDNEATSDQKKALAFMIYWQPDMLADAAVDQIMFNHHQVYSNDDCPIMKHVRMNLIQQRFHLLDIAKAHSDLQNLTKQYNKSTAEVKKVCTRIQNLVCSGCYMGMHHVNQCWIRRWCMMLFDVHAKEGKQQPWNGQDKCYLTGSIGEQLKEILWNDTITYGRARKYHEGRNWSQFIKAKVNVNTKFRVRENDKLDSEDHQFMYFDTEGAVFKAHSKVPFVNLVGEGKQFTLGFKTEVQKSNGVAESGNMVDYINNAPAASDVVMDDQLIDMSLSQCTEIMPDSNFPQHKLYEGSEE